MTKNRSRSTNHRLPFGASIGVNFALLLAPALLVGEETNAQFKTPKSWRYSAPLIAPENRETKPSHAQKDPTIVFHDGKWHVFMTVKLPKRSAIEYCQFEKWEDANKSKRTLLTVSESDYFCAPQVFFFRPHKKWYLVYQMGVPDSKKMWVAYSTTTDISDPHSWTKAKAMLDGGPDDPRTVGGLDYWIICNDTHAYLFFTSLNGKMWRCETKLADFPAGFTNCQLALQAKIFEASHTYRIKGSDQYLTIIEENGRRYFKAFVADRLDGKWRPVGDNALFAAAQNIQPQQGVEAWTDNVSHGELIRYSNDETLTIDPEELEFVFQGMWQKEKAKKNYGQFTWRIGKLTPGD